MTVHWSTYFNLCFHIINIIDRSELNFISESVGLMQEDKRKKYFEIFKVTFSQYELEALFFLLIFDTKYIGIKKKVEKYSMFSFLDVDHKRYEDKNSKLTSIAYLYDGKAFGNNPNWMKYFFEIKLINVRMTEKEAKQLIKMLVKVGYLNISNNFNPYIKNIKFSIINNYEVNINSNDHIFGNVITSYNKDFIKNFYRSSYYSLLSQIKNKKMMIDDINKLLRLIKKNCILNNDFFEIEKQYKVDGSSFVYIPRDLYDQINGYKNEILKLKDELMELDAVFEKLESSKYLETILVLLKYQIDFDDFKKTFYFV
ncbi:putative phage abortive infection protein [Acinetobacter baumannii]